MERLKYWLALNRAGVSERAAVMEALRVFGEAAPLFNAPRARLEEISPALTKLVYGEVDWKSIDVELERAASLGIRILTIMDEHYPSLLHSSYDAPLVLYVKGGLSEKEFAERAGVGVVGTRHPTHYGLKMAELISAGLAAAGLSIISGMARGCDSAAHTGALKAGGITVAVLGTGLDVVYPPENKKLYNEITERGLVISEFPLATAPHQFNFPRRNRIISGLSLGIMVAEAPLRSGAMMTARLALESGREVFAVPGKADLKQARGSNKLLRSGAVLVEEPQDILDALGFLGLPLQGSAEESADRTLLAERLGRDFGSRAATAVEIIGLLAEGPLHIESIIERAALSVEEAGALLMEMELRGFLKKRPDNFFAVC